MFKDGLERQKKERESYERDSNGFPVLVYSVTQSILLLPSFLIQVTTFKLRMNVPRNPDRVLPCVDPINGATVQAKKPGIFLIGPQTLSVPDSCCELP